MYAVGMAPDAGMKQAVVQRIEQVQSALAPWHAGHLLNFTDRPGRAARMFGKGAYDRLREVKARYDPDDVIQANHEISPAD